jgi:hypothetical protein
MFRADEQSSVSINRQNLMPLPSVLFQRNTFCLNHIRSKMNERRSKDVCIWLSCAHTDTRSGDLIELQPHPTSRNTGCVQIPWIYWIYIFLWHRWKCTEEALTGSARTWLQLAQGHQCHFPQTGGSHSCFVFGYLARARRSLPHSTQFIILSRDWLGHYRLNLDW